MILTVLEITDKTYLIKLDKQEFDLPFINSLLKRINKEKTFLGTSFQENENLVLDSRAFEEREVDHLSEK